MQSKQLTAVKKKLIIILFLCFLLINKEASAQVNATDSLALVDLYDSTDGVNWINNTNWLTKAPLSNWFGVTVQNQRVFLVQVDVNNVSGHLPSSLGNLSAAVSISFQGDSLTGNIPSSFKNLINLNFLYLDQNLLSGQIDSSLLTLPNLSVLLLGFNNFSDTIPDVFTKNSKLGILDLSNNQFVGKAPSSFSNLSNLQWLYINNNELKDTIPSLHNLSNLTNLGLEDNNFTFNGMEDIALSFPFATYAPQAIIKLHLINTKLSVSAGGTLSNNTYRWYKNGSLVNSVKGDSVFSISETGSYSVAVTNDIATSLTLFSDTINVTTLPVDLISFTATNVKGQVQLNWNTVSEINSSYYEIQKSTDGVHFTTAGKVNAIGSSTNNNYSFTDISPAPGNNYYRLKQVDVNGSFTYSKALFINVNGSGGFKVYPTITSNHLHISVTQTPSTLVIYNAVGKPVQTISVNNADEDINVSGLSTGSYIIRNITTNSSLKFIKQ